jgi:hypothetical protein
MLAFEYINSPSLGLQSIVREETEISSDSSEFRHNHF